MLGQIDTPNDCLQSIAVDPETASKNVNVTSIDPL
jgi:hypothetical protein